MSLNFFSLPYLFQKRFVEIAETEAISKFFELNEYTATFSKQRNIIGYLDMYYSNKNTILTPRIKDVRYVEIIGKLNIRNDFKMDVLPAYFTKVVIKVTEMDFQILKSFVEHKFLKSISFFGALEMGDETKEEIQKFFDHLLKLDEVKFEIKHIGGKNDNKNFERVAAKSLYGVSYTYLIYHRQAYKIMEFKKCK